MKFSYTASDQGESLLLVFSDGTVRNVTTSNLKFEELRNYLVLGNAELPDDEGYVKGLVDVGSRTVEEFQRLSERVTFESGHIHWDGEKMDNALSRHIVRMILNDDDSYQSMVAFMENLSQNPSYRSRRQLFNWLSDRDFTITRDGMFLAYKGLTSDGLSIHSGGAYVNDVWVEGQVPNEPGSVITLPRVKVDDDPNAGCSVGLHAGTSGYARDFGDKVVLVAINPRDVVSVPSHMSYQKLRVCRYVVADESLEDISETTYQGRHTWNPDLVEVDDVPEDALQCVACQDFLPEDAHEGDKCANCAAIEEEEDDYWNGGCCDDCDDALSDTDLCDC